MISVLITIFSLLFPMGDKPSFSHEFSLYAPAAVHVTLVIFENVEDSLGTEYSMKKVGNEFILELPQIENGTLYGFKVKNGNSVSQQFTSETIITDPFSNALATQNHYAPINKSIIYKSPFDWGNDGQFTWVNVPSRDLIIYEAHLKDMTMHLSSKADQPGTYLGFVEPNQKGGISHLKKMGRNSTAL